MMPAVRPATGALFDELAAVAPWAMPFIAHGGAVPDATPEFLAARRRASLDRHGAGLDAWNDWAFTLLKLRHDHRDDPDGLALVAVVAAADFSGADFASLVDFGACHFPGDAIFTRARFRRDVWFADAKFHGDARFAGAELEGKVWMEFAKLTGRADFTDVLFAKTAEVRDARFLGPASFRGATFLDAWFRGTEWHGDVSFAGARFAGEAGLGACRWHAACDFSRVAFADNAGFDRAQFAGPVTFAGTRFGRNARFDGATFAVPPVFDRASFAMAPRPPDVVPPPQGSPVHEQIGEIRRRLGLS